MEYPQQKRASLNSKSIQKDRTKKWWHQFLRHDQHPSWYGIYHVAIGFQINQNKKD